MKWIEWIPDTEVEIHRQLLQTAGKHAGVIWMITPPPEMRLGLTPVDLAGVEHYMREGGLPVGYVDLKGNVQNFIIKPPFDPPNFRGFEMSGITVPYGFPFRKEFLNELYNELCFQNMDRARSHSA